MEWTTAEPTQSGYAPGTAFYSNGSPSTAINLEGIPVSLQNHDDDFLAALYSSDSPEDGLAWLKENNPEVYHQLLAELQTNRSYWDEYRKYQSDYYSIQKESLEKAGMNPWLALQNFGSIGTGSVGSASSVNPSSTLKAQREAKNSELAGKGIAAAGTIIGAIIGALIMAML